MAILQFEKGGFYITVKNYDKFESLPILQANKLFNSFIDTGLFEAFKGRDIVSLSSGTAQYTKKQCFYVYVFT